MAGQKSINEVEAIYSSITTYVDESKRKQKVCIHWMKNQCKKGDRCEYLHTYVEEKVPICRYIQSDGFCQKEDQCIYRHPKPEEAHTGMGKKQEHCPYFQRGFCKLSFEYCPFYHDDSQRICVNYFLGFCPEGPNCPNEHVKSSLSPHDLSLSALAYFPQEDNWIDSKMHQQHNNQMSSGNGGGYGNRNQPGKIICHRCGKEGHKSTYCQEDKITEDQLAVLLCQDPASQIQNLHVNCFYCKQKGHYASHCPMKQIKNVNSQQPVVNREQRLHDQIMSIQPTAPSNFNGGGQPTQAQEQAQLQQTQMEMEVQEMSHAMHMPRGKTQTGFSGDFQMNDMQQQPSRMQEENIQQIYQETKKMSHQNGDSAMNACLVPEMNNQNQNGVSSQQQSSSMSKHQEFNNPLTSDKELNASSSIPQQTNQTQSSFSAPIDDQFVPVPCLHMQDLPLTLDEVKNAIFVAAQEIQGIQPMETTPNGTTPGAETNGSGASSGLPQSQTIF